MEAFNYFNDVCFAVDIIVNFRTMFVHHQTGDMVTGAREIARNYVLHGRFFVDIIATVPLEFIGEVEGLNVSPQTLKLIQLVKLTRLFRLGRIITFI